jgi:hypothetical protein
MSFAQKKQQNPAQNKSHGAKTKKSICADSITRDKLLANFLFFAIMKLRQGRKNESLYYYSNLYFATELYIISR